MRKSAYKVLTKVLARYYGSPQFLILYLTNECWMKCKHCFYNEEFRNKRNIQDNSLSFDEIRMISHSMKKVLNLSLTGGEPFLRDDLEDIVDLFTKTNKTFRYQIPTSGYDTFLIVEKTIKILNNNPSIPLRIHVSLDGNEEIHEIIRCKKGSFGNAVKTIAELYKLKKKYPYFDVSIITTVCSHNQYILEELSNFVSRILPGGEWCVNFVRGEPRNPVSSDVKPENYAKVDELFESRKGSGSYKGHLTSKWLTAKNAARRKIILKILKNKYKGGGCSAGSLGGVIYPNGSVFPCEILNHCIGNLRDYNYDFSDLWNSKEADRIRNWIQDSGCLCTHECYLSTNFLIQPRMWPSLLSERLKLLRKDLSNEIRIAKYP